MTDEAINAMDPYMLLSMINMKLRDFYESLSALCDDLDITKAILEKKLNDAGYSYITEINQFK